MVWLRPYLEHAQTQSGSWNACSSPFSVACVDAELDSGCDKPRQTEKISSGFLVTAVWWIGMHETWVVKDERRKEWGGQVTEW